MFCNHYSSHNWNTLFLGANTVADVMVEKYRTAKSDILDNVSDCNRLLPQLFRRKYSITCIQRLLKGSNEIGLLQQVVFKCRFY